MRVQSNTNVTTLILLRMFDIFLKKLKTEIYRKIVFVTDCYEVETIIAQFVAEFPIFLYDIDLTLKILFKIYIKVKLAAAI